MRLWLISSLCLGVCFPTCLLPVFAHDNTNQDARFKLSLRSSLRVPGGSLASSLSWGELLASNEDINERNDTTTDDETSDPYSYWAPPAKKKHVPFLKLVKKKGRVSIQLANTQANNANATGALMTSNLQQSDAFSTISVDPFAAIRLLGILGVASSHFLTAFVGTLKLLGPLIFARKVLAQFGELVTDYMMGRYLRTTYDRFERKYWKEYQGPAACRSFGRCLTHTLILFLLGQLMEWMVGLKYSPCVIQPPKTEGYISCHWWCGLLWLIATVGSGNLVATLFASRGPLKIKVTKSSLAKKKKRPRVFFQPWNYLSWLRDPDKLITQIATNRRDNAKSWKPFTPEPLLFPSTWPPFSILRNFGIAKAMASSSNMAIREYDSMHLIMKQFLIQEAILQEWHRVLMDERRVGLGVFLIGIGFTASCFLFVTIAYSDGISAVLMIPALLATFSSAWMNLFVFWDRRRDMEANQNIIVLRDRRRLRSPSYSIKW